MDWITEHIALGGAEDLEHLEAGFDAALCCTMPGETEYLVSRWIEFMRLPFNDGEPIPEQLLLRAVGFIARHVRADHRVFVHCYGGISRSPSVVAAYLALADGIAPDVSISQVQSCRRCVSPHADIWN
jgi:hypothetical protein